MLSHFFWKSLLLSGGIIVITTVLIIQLAFPSSFGIPPSFRLWKLAFNSVLLIGWVIISWYFWKKKLAPFFVSPVVAFRQGLIRQAAVLIIIFLFTSTEALTNGQPLDFSIHLGLFVGFLFGILSIPRIFLYWRQNRRAEL